GEELSFTVSAVDPQGRELTYSAEPLQPGMIFDASTGLFSWSPELSQEGSYTVTFSVTNGLFTDSETITITVLPPVGPLPTASITSPVDSSTYIVNDEVIFTGIGDGVSITSFEWVSDRDGLLHEGIGNFSTFKSTSLSVGVHDITFTVYDVYGRSASDSIAVRVRELFEPTASITTPTDGDRFKETHTVFVSALVSDSDGVIENYTLYSDKDGVLAQSALGESSATLNFDLMNLSVGRHALSLTVFDDDGLSASDSVYFYVDALTAPVITIVSPLHQDTYKVGEEIIFKAEAYDEDGEVISIEWTSSIDGFIGLGSEFTLHNLSFGKHTVNAVATDNDGLTSTASVVFEVKPLEAPTALIIHPTSGSVFYKDQPITFEGNASDPDGIVTDITWSSSLDGIFHTDYCGLPSCSFIFNYSNLSLGRHDITLTVVDDDVLQYTDTYTVWILINPLEAPMVTITSPDNGAVFGRQELILFTANVTSMHEIVEYTWKTDATGVIANGTGLPQPFTKQFEKGSYVATLIVRDEHGLTSQGTVQFSVVDGEPVPIPEPVVEPFTDVYVSSMRLLNPNERVESGDYAYFTFTFRNRGDISVQDLTVQIAIPELGISRRSRNFELSQDGMVTTTLVLPIPHGVYPGEYLARATLTGENVRRVQHRHVMII
ncbi:MAG: Ig-like domain-containing protein, partial [Candidatus Woesearchaeota archaeon]